MDEFKPGDRVLVAATFLESRWDGSVLALRYGTTDLSALPVDVFPCPLRVQTHPLDAAVAELGRVTGLSGDDLLTAAKRAILSAAQRIIVAGVDLRVAREEAMDDIRRAIGEAPPSVLEHAAALPPDDNTDDTPF